MLSCSKHQSDQENTARSNFSRGKGRLRALAVTSKQRAPQLKDVPAVAETLPGFENLGWFGLMAPAGTPRDAVTRLHDAVQRSMQSPEVREKFLAQGAEPLSGTPQDAGAYLRAEVAKWGKVVKASGARVE